MFEIVYHPLFAELAELDQPKPLFETYETPLRMISIWNYLKKIGFITRDFSDTNLMTNPDKNLIIKKPEPLTKEDVLLVHSQYLYDLVERMSIQGIGKLGDLVQVTPNTLEIALLSAGAVYEAIIDVIGKKVNQSFAISRPPGHHAHRESSEGLCVFNNIAVAIQKLRKYAKFKGKIAIIDIDAHFGDGLSKIFYEDPMVLYTSIHEYDYGVAEPGYFTEIGNKHGEGYNINFPIPLQSMDIFLEKYCKFIEPFIETFKPELIIVATGFDGHWADPLGNLGWTSKGYENFAVWVKKISERICGGKVCFTLEGGYNLLMIPRLVETMICPFINVKPNPPIDLDVQDELQTRVIVPGVDSFEQFFNKEVADLKKKLNKIYQD